MEGSGEANERLMRLFREHDENGDGVGGRGRGDREGGREEEKEGGREGGTGRDREGQGGRKGQGETGREGGRERKRGGSGDGGAGVGCRAGPVCVLPIMIGLVMIGYDARHR